ncbi:ribosomal protection-like ABC-F family protein [Paenibacillus piri]|uniref:ABC-F family ATP-binding cassette domain-containing protein n=1 Tax=Paenibacillus piri TaxID=2547395 RepID=A0A4R5KFI9_9BACL|nr:ABC-F family ATP-binding cassette domain-containing protein [Paenibacillus piri]TDF92950.1 ABC-F family ATP-binding cassette domain-containing protein [Paenibacillus piri]
MLTINCQNVKKYNAAQLVLENVTFELNHGEKAGLVGRNGCGKTTLLSMIAKLDSPDEGMLAVRKNARVGYLQQIPDMEAGTTVLEVLVTGFRELLDCRERMAVLESAMSSPELIQERLEALLVEYAKLQERYERDGGYELDARIDQIADGLRIPRKWYSRAYDSLSGGERTKVGLASQLLMEPELLLLDEPTNHLDMAAVEWLEEFLLKYRGACLIVSHDRYFLDRVVMKIVELEDGESTVFHTNYTRYVKEKEELLLRQFADYQEQQKKIKKMREIIKQLLEWGRIGDNGKFFRRAASMQEALDRMEKLKRPAINRKEAEFELRPSERSGKQVVILDCVEKHYWSKTVLAGVTGELHYGEKVVLVGDNGSGKSTLLKIILGEVSADGGEARLGSRVDVGYLAQQQLPDNPEQSVLDYYRGEAGLEEGEARNRLAGYLFYGADVFKPVRLLSGGEWTRLRLALLVNRKPNLLILDEPTNHMDIASREVLEEALGDYPGTILIVTHDRYLMNRLAQKIWELDRGRLSVYLGGFDEYKAESRRRNAVSVAGEVEERRRLRLEPNRTSPVAILSEKGDQASKKLEEEIEETERRLAELEVAPGELGQGAEAVSRLERDWAESEVLRERLDRLIERWVKEQRE